jgi:hypothetical protein
MNLEKIVLGAFGLALFDKSIVTIMKDDEGAVHYRVDLISDEFAKLKPQIARQYFARMPRGTKGELKAKELLAMLGIDV